VQFKFSVYQRDVLGACANSAESVLNVRPDAILSSHAAHNQQYNGVSFLTVCFVAQEMLQNIF
jgi:ABC-type hemin transport system substrate-binding protein